MVGQAELAKVVTRATGPDSVQRGFRVTHTRERIAGECIDNYD